MFSTFVTLSFRGLKFCQPRNLLVFLTSMLLGFA